MTESVIPLPPQVSDIYGIPNRFSLLLSLLPSPIRATPASIYFPTSAIHPGKQIPLPPDCSDAVIPFPTRADTRRRGDKERSLSVRWAYNGLIRTGKSALWQSAYAVGGGG